MCRSLPAGGICDGPTMAAAFAMGAEGVQLGTAMLSCSDSPVHQNWKNAIYEGKGNGYLFS
jgi:enoyl-[acyl-carrier protein] reductase II